MTHGMHQSLTPVVCVQPKHCPIQQSALTSCLDDLTAVTHDLTAVTHDLTAVMSSVTVMLLW